MDHTTTGATRRPGTRERLAMKAATYARHAAGFTRSTAGLAAKVAAVALVAGLAGTGTAFADRTLERLSDFDLPGADYRTLRSVPLEQCEDACLGDSGCAAFTYNERARWCFLKSTVGERVSYPGATSGIVRETADPGQTLPLPDIAYLPASLEADAGRLEAQLAAVRRTRSKVGLITPALAETASRQRADDYLALAESLRNANFEDYFDRQEATRIAGAAAYLGLKSAISPPQQGRALALISRVMEDQGLFRPAIEASAASLSLYLNATERDRLAELRSQHGFRVLDYNVDSDTTAPRLCIQFSEALSGEATDLQRFVTVDGIADPTISVEASQLCVEGLEHGGRYIVTVREGLPSTVSETLAKPAEFRAYVRDRSPLARFETNRFVLPAAAQGVPVTSVNSEELELKLYRVNDRNIADVVRRDDFKRALYPYEADDITEESGSLVWEGTLSVENTRNEDVRTLIPLDNIIRRTEPGVYVMTAVPVELADRSNPMATQWFVVSDLGLSTFSSGGTVDVFVRSLLSADALDGVEVTLLARNDEVLATATTDADGHARLVSSAPTDGGQAPVLVTAHAGEDYAFLPLKGSAFELTDRGVSGRAAPGPVDAFLATERGVYRGGETVHLTALVRDDSARALPLPVTVRLTRPDGVVSRTLTARADSAGGLALDMPLTSNAATGTWTVAAYIDPKGNAVGQTTFLVEDYVPQRIEVNVTSALEEVTAGGVIDATVKAEFLYGAPAADLIMEGSLTVRQAAGLEGFDGYRFGLVQEPFTPTRTPLFDLPRTGSGGLAQLAVKVPELEDVSAALEARLVISVREPGGRQVSDALTLPLATDRPLIGIRPKFSDGRVGEGTRAGFDVIALSSAHERIPAGAEWTLTRISRDYQWYRRGGSWFYDSVDRLEEVARGTVDIEAGNPAAISVPVEWGRYRLEVVDQSDERIASSVAFDGGWVSEEGAADTPDILEVHLDKESYSPGETATLRIVPRYAGKALVTVLSGGVRHHRLVDVPATGADVPLTVEDGWAPGAYVAATLFRPVEIAAGSQPLPQRSIGIAHMSVGTAERRLDVAIDAPDMTGPRQTLDVPVTVGNLDPGETAYLTLAAVDVGILNITGYEAPDAAEHYLGQRRLAVELRDLYGDLIDASGALRGRIRSGGDGPGSGTEALPLSEEPVALFTGVLTAGPDGKAMASLDIPSFNGTLRLMAIVWTDDKVGNADRDMVVRDPVVVAGTLPRFLAPGDATRMRIDLHNVAHAAGEYRLAVAAGGPVALDREAETFTLDQDERTSFEIPLSATGVGEATIIARLDGPDGLSIAKDYTLVVRPAAAEVRERRVSVLNPGESLTLSDTILRPYDSDAEVTLSVGEGDLDIAGLLRMLDRFPYGCSEQTVSRALPLLYVNDVGKALGIDPDTELPERIRQAVSRVLANQSSSGGFGLWSPGYDLWLTAYVMDFLTRAREAGYEVPTIAFQSGLDRLQSVLSYVGDIEGERGAEIAYAIYVLARNGRAAIGDVRYFAEERLDDFPAPLARAQLAASLALNGDEGLAERIFATALPEAFDLPRLFRVDFGTSVRDAAAIVALAAESRVSAPVLDDLEARLDALRAGLERNYSTQEAAWLLLSANALRGSTSDVSVDGVTTKAPFSRGVTRDELAGGLLLSNLEDRPLAVATTVTGSPLAPQPPVQAGLTVERTFHTLEGEEIDISSVAQNTRIVVSVTFTKTVGDAMHVMLTDLLPAGFEIENPRLVGENDLAAIPLARSGQSPEHTEFRDDRFAAAWDLSRGSQDVPITVSYIVRAVTPGTFTLPASEVSAMYQPNFVARSEAGFVSVVPTR
ncbi:hypothetical protein DLJ53_26020 [Acuticoccus sediminis]|uniref:Apple domain-containing protein n=1 Tax=Acuticoccus sediminis TaxID=2184697 RepID=A0A8B2NN78_9HYPH|nr:alpha-2-macroglobulin family protein [Acuticoccus sediminis]RAH98177.1 hypothetical protein DLJ53_26020 [Acuticoccus sediminis]